MSDQVRNQNVGFLMTRLTSGPIFTKLMYVAAETLGPIIVYSNDDPSLTLIYFVAGSNYVHVT